MRRIDQEYTAHPFYGSRRMTAWLQGQGEAVNRKWVQRLMRLMRLEAIYPKPRLSVPGSGHRVYPYLLRGVVVERPDQVWAADITYVPLVVGFRYLAAIIDWYSRSVIAWRLSNTLEGRSAWNCWRRPWPVARRSCSTPIKGCSSRRPRSRGGWNVRGCG
jgi:putative transposase